MKYGWLLVAMVLMTVGCGPAADSDTPAKTDASASVSSDATHVSLLVPKMECPVACWPKVKETLETQPFVTNVTLAPQQDENVIDNPQVVIEFAEGFDTEKAIEAISDAGFDGASVVAAK